MVHEKSGFDWFLHFLAQRLSLVVIRLSKGQKFSELNWYTVKKIGLELKGVKRNMGFFGLSLN